MDKLKFILTTNYQWPGSVSVITTLTHSPMGWDESIIKYIRSDKYFGLFKSVTPKLQFVKEGAEILRDMFYKRGIEADAILTIQILDSVQLTYSDYYIGNVDFSTFKDNLTDVEVVVVQSGDWEKIKSKFDNEYEIDIDTNAGVKTLKFQPLPLEQSRTYEVSNSNVNTPQPFKYDHYIGLNEIDREIFLEDSISNSHDCVPIPVVTPVDFTFFTFFPFWAAKTGNVTFDINISGTYFFSVPDGTSFAIYLGAEWAVYDYQIGSFTATQIMGSWNISGTVTIAANALPSDKWSLRIINNANSDYVWDNFSGSVKVTYNGVPSLKYIKCIPIKNLFEELLKNANDGSLPAYSSTFLTSISDYLITSGDSIRGLAGSKIKTSLSKFYDSLNKIWNLGLDFGYITSVQKIILEEKAYFFNNTFLYDFGEVNEFGVEVWDQFIDNSISVGYKPKTIEGKINGKYEPNLEQNWNIPIVKKVSNGNYDSDYRTDLYGITFVCLNLEHKTTTDNSSDNDIFIIHTETSGGVTTLNNDFDLSSVAGFPFPGYLFNFKLTPKRNFLRWGNIWSSICQFLDTKYITFGTATQNKDLVVKANDEAAAITESADALVSDLPTMLFQPYIFNISVIIPDNFDTTLITNKNGYCTFTFQNNVYKIYLQELNINQSRKAEFTIKGISHPSNDMSKLIR